MQDYHLAVAEDEKIPSILRALPRWCRWSLKDNGRGQLTKPLDQSPRDVSRCRTWDQIAHVPRTKTAGLGLLLTGGVTWPLEGGGVAHLVMLDLDGCVDPATGELSPWAAGVVARCASYVERSPSGTGLRIAVLTKKPLAVARQVVMLNREPPPGVKKRPSIQLFGLGPTGYVTITGDRLPASTEDVRIVHDLDWLLDLGFGAADKLEAPGASKATAYGDEPTLDEITAVVSATQNGPDLIDAQWERVVPDKSASEGYHVLVIRALQAGRGHIDAVARWLIERTAWGRGEVDSRDPRKYQREGWVQREVQRTAGKAAVVDVTEVFDDEGPAPARVDLAPEPGVAAAKGVDVADQWEKDGPLVHLPTGIDTLDAMTGGGLVLGSRVYVVGAPNAGKTALAVQIADEYLRGGITVGILGVDEEPSDIAGRLLQRRGHSRQDVEQRAAALISAWRDEAAQLPLMLFDGGTSIEEAAHALHLLACERHPGVDRPPCVLVIDSVQTARSKRDDADDSIYRSVTQRVAAIRAAASRYRMLVLTTSEMSRAAYRNKKTSENIDEMASAKESGAIEFSARVMLSLKNAPGESNVVELRVVKNKHGPDHRQDQPGIFLRVDRAAQKLTEEVGFKLAGDDDADDGDEKRLFDAVGIVRAIQAGAVSRNKVSAATKLSRRRADEMLAWLLGTGGVTNDNGLRVHVEALPVAVAAKLRADALGDLL